MSLVQLRSRGILDGTISAGDLATGVGGKVLQVITATDSTQRTTTSSTYATGSNTLSVSITPSSTSNKILILVNSSADLSNNGFGGNYTIYRNSTNLAGADGMVFMVQEPTGNPSPTACLSMSYLDSPNTTSSVTYQVYMKIGGSNTIYLNRTNTTGSITCLEIAG